MLTPEIEVWVYGDGAKYTPGLYLKGNILQDNICFPSVDQGRGTSRQAFSCLQNLLFVLYIRKTVHLMHSCFNLMVYEI